MEELRMGNNEILLEYIITTNDGKEIRMLLESEEYKSIRKVLNILADSGEVDNICDYGSKDIEVVGS